MMRPFQVTTKAAVIPSAGSKAASTAAATFSASSSAGKGSSESTSPMGQGWVEGSGRALSTATGLKYTDSTREVANVLGRKVRIKTRDEHGRAQDFSEACRMVLERVTRGRYILGFELK
jgi:hypothetical protein